MASGGQFIPTGSLDVNVAINIVTLTASIPRRPVVKTVYVDNTVGSLKNNLMKSGKG